MCSAQQIGKKQNPLEIMHLASGRADAVVPSIGVRLHAQEAPPSSPSHMDVAEQQVRSPRLCRGGLPKGDTRLGLRLRTSSHTPKRQLPTEVAPQ